MTIATHRFVSARPDGSDDAKARASNWNDGHVFAGGIHGASLTRDTTDPTYGAAWVSGLTVVNVKDYGATGNGTSDDSGAIRSALVALSAAGGGLCYIPAGTYRLRGKVTIPSSVTVLGTGRASTLKITDITAHAGTNPGDFDAFELAAGTTHVRILHLRFVGENNPFVFYLNNQSAAIGIRGSTCADVDVDDCIFEDLYGFTVHNEGSSERVNVRRNRMLNVANGLNVNGDYSLQEHNYLENVEGIEASGAYSSYSYNTIIDATGNAALSIGGRTSVGAAEPGVLVIGNLIVGGLGKGISVNDAVQDSLVAFNTIVKTYKIGIHTVSGGFNAVARVGVIGNRVIDAGEDSQTISLRTGLSIEHNDDGAVLDNYVTTGVYAGYTTAYALEVRAPRVTLGGNYLNGASKDASITTGATDTVLRPTNTFVNHSQEFISTSTLAFPASACTFARLTASPLHGMLASITDSTTTTWGATITGGGSSKVLAYYNGTNWTVAAK